MPHFHLPNPFRSHKPSPSHSSAHKRSQSQPRPLPPPPPSDPSPAAAGVPPLPSPAAFASSPGSPTSSLGSQSSGGHGHGGGGAGGRRLRLSRPGAAKRDSFGCADSNRVVSEEGERRRRELREKRSEGGLFRRARHERGGSIPVVKDFAFVSVAPGRLERAGGAVS